MTLCFVSPRFHPVIGGVEVYLKNIAEYCSSFYKTFVITSNLKNFPKSIFERSVLIKNKYQKLFGNVEIIRANTLKNPLLRSIFYLNHYLNKKSEIFLDKYLQKTPDLHFKNNEKIINFFIKSFIHQRYFTNPNFRQIHYILKKIYSNEKISIIHSSPIRFTSDILAFQFSRKNKIPFICTPLYHINPYADYILYPSINYILKNSDAVITCTNIEKDFFCKSGVDNKKIHIIPPGIDPTQYQKPNTKKFREKYNIPENSPLLFFMGRKDYAKGVLISILALNKLIKRYRDIKLIIAGPETREYSLLYKRLPSKLKAHIIDLGIINNKTKSDALASCDIFLLPSLDDAFGIVYLEAWLFKKPVIGALGGNVEGLIDNNKNGFLIPFKNIDKFASRVEELIKSETLRNDFGQNGYNKLMNEFTLDITNKKILNLYEQFIK